MPEASQLTLSINDRIVAVTPTARPDMTGVRVFEIPMGILKPGLNVVRILAEHRHRVDCSPAASYELWTTLDPDKTGLELGAETARLGFERVADLAAIAPGADGAVAVKIVVSAKLTMETAARALKAAQLATLSMGTMRALVTFGPASADGDLLLAVGTIDQLKTALDMSDFGAVTGPRLGFLRGNSRRPPVFVVTGASEQDLDAALASWEAERGDAPNLMGFSASGEAERVSFADLGLANVAFSGRLLRLGLDIAMPFDFLSADYGRLTLDLTGSHGAMLDKGARIQIRVNGLSAGEQGLRGGVVGSLDNRQILLPLSLMRPGQNHIEVTAETPSSTDARCISNRLTDETRLEILSRSAIELPRLARVAMAPELTLTAAGGFPFALADARPVLFVPNPDPSTMAAAATMVARLAVAVGHPINFSFTTTPPADQAGEVLIVSPAATLEPSVMRKAGLDPDRVRRIWQRPSSNGGASETEKLAPGECGPGSSTAERLTAPKDNSPSAEQWLMQRTASGLGALAHYFLWRGDGTQGGVAESEVISERSTLLLSQGFPAGSSRSPWTIVTAANAASLKAGVDCLTLPRTWERMKGRLSSLNIADDTMLWTSAGYSKRYLSTQPASFANTRLVAAGWLSLNPLFYIGFVFLVAALLALASLLLVRNIGRRRT